MLKGVSFNTKLKIKFHLGSRNTANINRLKIMFYQHKRITSLMKNKVLLLQL